MEAVDIGAAPGMSAIMRVPERPIRVHALEKWPDWLAYKLSLRSIWTPKRSPRPCTNRGDTTTIVGKLPHEPGLDGACPARPGPA